MPLYEYACQHCGKRFEALQKFSDEPLQVHPECGGGPVERLLSAPSLQFKGTGWYVTDYAKSNGHSSAGSEKSGESSDKKSDQKKESKSTESKPASSSPGPSTTSTTKSE